ncbi:MAG: family 20 glycosylhydrolase [Lentisphaerae bacterium]|nr:family 20 glycosylhydrolase [Lentisphaerota bacterium]MCP4100625.1 family 20 glycosylhydrolase [Lentisphaerota bacterium]
MTKDYIKRYIDIISGLKMNVLHLHLADDQGWRLQIDKHPKLTQIGAVRNDGTLNDGGYYTKSDIAEIVQYGKERNVTIIPEIEMPGHSLAALAAYPELSCKGKGMKVATDWGGHHDYFCAGNEQVYTFLKDVLLKVIDMFPSKYIHLGADECWKDTWKKCPKCQQKMQQQGFISYDELQSYFVKRIASFVNQNGRKIIGWDEILEGGTLNGAVIQWWRESNVARKALSSGHKLICSPMSHLYLYRPDSELPVAKVYTFDMSPGKITAEQAKLIIGGEAALWTEYVPQTKVDSFIFPRLLAVSEIFWTAKENRDYNSFKKRMISRCNALKAAGIKINENPFDPGEKLGEWTPDNMSEKLHRITWDIPTKKLKDTNRIDITFTYDNGAHGLEISKLELLKDNIPVAADSHRGWSGAVDRNNIYSISPVKYAEGSSYKLRASVRSDGGTDSQGYVWLKCSPDINIYEWQPKTTAKAPKTISLNATKFIDQNGKYILKFDYQDGGHGLGISRVAIYDADNRIVAEDKHNGFTGTRSKNNIYSLKISNWEPHNKYRIELTSWGEGGTDSRGILWLRKLISGK